MTYHLTGVPADKTNTIWEEVAPILKRAVDRTDRYTMDDIYRYIVSQDMQLWLIIDHERLVAVFVTEIVCYPQMKVLACPFVAGHDAKDWIHLISEVEEFAKSKGCSEVEPPGRKGWRKLLPPQYKEYVTIFRKKI